MERSLSSGALWTIYLGITLADIVAHCLKPKIGYTAGYPGEKRLDTLLCSVVEGE